MRRLSARRAGSAWALILVLSAIAGATPASARPRVPVLAQGRLPACLAFASAAVAQYHGESVDPLALQRAVKVTEAGVAYSDVVAVLQRWGIRASLARPSVAELRAALAAGLPLVIGQARSSLDHAIVVESYAAQRAVYRIMDPSHPAARERPAALVDERFEAAGARAIVICPQQGGTRAMRAVCAARR